jgi:hypothetical protein
MSHFVRCVRPPVLLLAAVLVCDLAVPVAAEEAAEEKSQSCSEQWRDVCPGYQGPRKRRACLNRERARFTPECYSERSEAIQVSLRNFQNIHRVCKADRKLFCAEVRGAEPLFDCLQGQGGALSLECAEAFDVYTEGEAALD